jgi:adenylate cyclase
VPVQTVERKLAAIFAADIAGYSRLMARDEVATLARLKACRAGTGLHG